MTKFDLERLLGELRDGLLDGLLDALPDALKRHPEVVVRVLDALEPQVKPEAIYLRVAEWGDRIGVSRRTAWTLVGKGAPTVGSGRLRRVDVRAADAWLAARAQTDDAIERRARKNASKTARKAGA